MTLAVNIAQGGSNNVTFRNRIINGGMVIDQRNAGATTTSNSTYTLDRWGFSCTQNTATVGQNYGGVTPPAGFSNYLGIKITTTGTLGANDYNQIYQVIEGYNIADLNWGSANAKPITFSFWVYSSVTGTWGGSLRNGTLARSYPFTYTISSANTWEQKTITVAGDTSGTWATTNGAGMYVTFSYGAGSNFSGTAGAWAATNYNSATGAVSIVTTSNATFYVTGVQLEAGTTASPFEYRQYGTELALCQRYYVKFNGSQYLNESVGVAAATTVIYYNKPFKSSMRAAPTFSSSGSFNADGTSYSSVTLSMPYASTEVARIDGAGSGFTAGQAYALTHQSTNSYLEFSAEL